MEMWRMWSSKNILMTIPKKRLISGTARLVRKAGNSSSGCFPVT